MGGEAVASASGVVDHGELERLPAVAQVGLALALGPVGEVTAGTLLHSRPGLLERPRVGLVERDEEGGHVVAAQVGYGEAQRAQHPADAGHEHRPHPQLLGQGAGVH